LADYKKHLKK